MTTRRRMANTVTTLREAKGMSQAALGQRARITREYVNRLESGRYNPTVGVLTRVAKALGVPVTELLGPRP